MLLKFRIWKSADKKFAFYNNWFPDEDGEVELFTGKTDSKGVDIYEGDFITYSLEMSEPYGMYSYKVEQRRPAFVTYFPEGACFHLFTKKFTPLHRVLLPTVVGNRHENPELLS